MGSLMALPRLKILSLRGTGITDASVPALASSSQLVKLHIGSQAISQAGRDQPERTLAACDIFD